MSRPESSEVSADGGHVGREGPDREKRPPARPRVRYRDVSHDTTGASGEYQHPVGEKDRLLNAVRHENDSRAGRVNDLGERHHDFLGGNLVKAPERLVK